MATPAGAGEEEEEFEIKDDDGFVYKLARGLYPDVAPSSATQAAAGPDPEAARRGRRRRALLRLRTKRLRELSRWEALATDLAPLPAPAPLPPQAPSVSPHPAAAAASLSVLDDLLAQAEVQAEMLQKVSQLCDEIVELCKAHEADIVDAVAALPVWGNPRELIKSLCSPDEETVPGDLDEGNGGFQRLESQQCKRTIEAGSYYGGKEAAGASSVAVQRIKNSGDKRIRGPYQCKTCFQFGHTEKSCCETPAELGDEFPPRILNENRKRKGAASPSGSNSVAANAHYKSKRKKASGSTSTPSGTPGSITRRKAASTPRTPETPISSGPTTRRRAAAQNVSPGG